MFKSRKRKCLACGEFFIPDHRNRKTQRYCSKTQCRKKSHSHSQRRWLNDKGKKYFRSPEFYQRLKDYRLAHPRPKAPFRPKTSPGDKDLLLSQVHVDKELRPSLTQGSNQDRCPTDPPLKKNPPTSSFQDQSAKPGDSYPVDLPCPIQTQQDQGLNEKAVLPPKRIFPFQTPENFRANTFGDKDFFPIPSHPIFPLIAGFIALFYRTTDKDFIAKSFRQIERKGLEICGGSPLFSAPVKGEAHAETADRT